MDEDKAVASCDDALLDLAIESWRFARMFEKNIDFVDPKIAQRQANRLRYFQAKIEVALKTIDATFVNLEGQAYLEGMAATPLNAADFDPADELVVEQMVTPVVMSPHGLKKQGTMMLGKAR